VAPRPLHDRAAHIGVHPQKQQGMFYVGIACGTGRLTHAQLHGLAAIAERHGSASLRLTVWQNLLIPDIAEESLPDVKQGITALGLAWDTDPLHAGLVACTGNAGCKFAASDTKKHASEIADWLAARIAIRAPINIHLTGCHHSCAQHYIADIGLLGAKIEQGEDMLEGYDLHVGGGSGADAKIGRLIRPGLTVEELKPILLALLTAWQSQSDASFQAWTAMLSDDELTALCSRELVDA
jgi:ferredoxin-nitrite reductase